MTYDDGQGLIDVTRQLDPSVWKKALFVLTFANKLEVPTSGPESKMSRAEYCDAKVREWRSHIIFALKEKAEVPDEIVRDISVVPVGKHSDNPPGVDDWYTDFWVELFKKTRERGRPGMLRLAWNRLHYDKPNDKAPGFNESSSKKSSILPVHIFDNDKYSNSVRELRRSLPSSPQPPPVRQSNTTHLVIRAEGTRGRSVSQPRPPSPAAGPVAPVRQPADEAPANEAPTDHCPADHGPADDPPTREQTWRKAGKIGLMVGGGAVIGAIVGMLVGLIGGPPGMGIGAAAGMAIGGGTGAGTIIARSIFKKMKDKKQKMKAQQPNIEHPQINQTE